MIITLRHSRRAFVEELDSVTSLGHGTGNGCREQLGLRGRGPSAVISDLGVLRPDPTTKELMLTSVHPGVSVDDVRDATGWDLRVADEVEVTRPPTFEELTVLRKLKAVS